MTTPPTLADIAATVSPMAGPVAGPAPSPTASGRRLTVVAVQAPDSSVPAGCNSSSPCINVPGEASRARRKTAARAGADIRGEALLTLARLRLATPLQLKTLLLPHQQDTDNIRLALRNLRAESTALTGRAQRAQQSYWYCTPAGLAEAAASGELGIIPFTAQGTVWPLEAFYLHDDDVAVVETLTAEIKVKQPRELADYAKAFVGLVEIAVYGDAARDLIRAAMDTLE